ERQSFVTLSRSDASQPFMADVTLSPFARSGPYEIRAIDVIDDTGTQLRITREDLIDRGLDYSADLANTNADNEDPSLQSFVVAPPSIAADGSIHIHVDVSASDNSSGVYAPFFTAMLSPSSPANLYVAPYF